MDYTLRSKVIRLAHSNPALRPHLLPVLKSAAIPAHLQYQNETISVPLSNGDRVEVGAEVHGSWAIHKSLGGGGWTVTFVPKGLALARPKTQMDARALLKAILEKVPSLANAASEADVRSHYNDIKDILRNPPKASGTAKRAPSMSLAQKRDQVIQWVLDAGMKPVGGRYGKAGDFFYPKGLPLGDKPTMAISVGARDLILNRYYMIEAAPDRSKQERWVMEKAELLSKVDEDLVKKWSLLAATAPTRSQVRGGR